MEFGVFPTVYLPQHLVDQDPEGAEHRRIMDEVEWGRAADRSGWKYLWATEHHFLREYSHMSANESFLAYMAGVTSNIHLGTGIFNITPPVNHPARVAERVAMIDHLSEGRFELGVGRGSSTTEQRGFGIEDPEETRLMLDEVVGQLKYMWRDGEYSYDGTYFSMPPREILPKPYTKPHPPMWIAAGNPDTFRKAARMGLGVLCFSTSSPEPLKPLIDIYKSEIANAEPVGDWVNDSILCLTQALCLEDGGRARQLATDMAWNYQVSLVFKYLDTFPRPPGIPEWPAVIPEPTVEYLEEGVAARQIMVGSPEECAAVCEEYEKAGADVLAVAQTCTTLPIDIIVESTELFGEQVIPAFDTDPVHRTTRLREAQLVS
ncbi:MAG: LLM class flavin-dependent oxidoreductase [Acidimicrobiales bacterium]|nr:LLM class flavin-dependent oxidoreductase [Acidimicrobiales bacterium]